MTITHYHCKRCDTTKAIEEFSLHAGENQYKSKPKYQYCKSCNAERAREWRKKNKNYKGTGALTRIPKEDRLLVSCLGSRITDCKARAKKQGSVCSIDKDYLYQLWKQQKGICALTGVAMVIEIGALTCVSVDKIEPEKGYVEGNVQLTAWAANRAKGDMSMTVFMSMCQRVIDYQKVQRLSKAYGE